MSFKCILLLYIIKSVFLVTQGEEGEKFFRNDYEYLPTTKNFYKVHTIGKTWNNAKIKCEREGAMLFYPDDEDEATEVIKLWNRTQPNMRWIFIGIAAWNAPEVFESIDGKAIWDIYNNWANGEPNNAGGVEDCVVFDKEGNLNDDRCDKSFPFICKKTLGTLEWNQKCHIYDQGYEINDMNDRCYKFHLTPMNWTEACAICHSEQSYLAIINSGLEHDYLVNIITNAPKDSVQGDYLRGAVHLGFKKRDTGDWITIKGMPMHLSGYNTWAYAQPDGGQNENCGSMFYSGQLNDIGCFQKMFFICEHELTLRNQDIMLKFGKE